MSQGGLLVALVLFLSRGALGEEWTFFKARGDGLCATTVDEGPLKKKPSLVFGFDCVDPSGGYDGTSKAKVGTGTGFAGILVEFAGLFTATTPDLQKKDFEDKSKVNEASDPDHRGSRASEEMTNGMWDATMGAVWLNDGKQIVAALNNAFLADLPEAAFNFADPWYLDADGDWQTGEGLCISPDTGTCGNKRAFQSPMIVHIFMGYFAYLPAGSWAHLGLALGYCMTDNVDVFFNDDYEMRLAGVKYNTGIKSMTFYKFESKKMLYYMIDEKFVTQSWDSSGPIANSEETGVAAARIRTPITNPSGKHICFYFMLYLAKEGLKVEKSFSQIIAATTGEFAEAVSKPGNASATKDGKPGTTKKKPVVTKMNGGEKGKTYAGVEAGTDGIAEAEASSAKYDGSIAAMATMAILNTLNMAL